MPVAGADAWCWWWVGCWVLLPPPPPLRLIPRGPAPCPPATPCLRPVWQVGGQRDEPHHDGAARRVPVHATRAAGHTSLWQLSTTEAF